MPKHARPLKSKTETGRQMDDWKQINQPIRYSPYDKGIASCNERITSLNKSITDLKGDLPALNHTAAIHSLISRIIHKDKVISDVPAKAIVKTLLQISFEEITLEMIKLEKAIYISKKNVNSDQIGKHWSDRYEAITMKAFSAVEKMVEAELYTDSDYAVYVVQANKQTEFIRALCE